MIQSKEELVAHGIIRPNGQDWRVRIVFVDGSEKVVRVSPGSIAESDAVDRALAHAKVLDPTAVGTVEATRVSKSTKVAAFGIITK